MSPSPAPRRPILIVDDDADVIRIAQRVLESSGWRVESTTDPREALAIAIAVEPCLLIVDLMMPHMDGEELVHALRAGLRDRAPKIALLSAAYSRDEVARRLDADASIAKPFDVDDLRDLAVRFARDHRDRRSSSRPPR